MTGQPPQTPAPAAPIPIAPAAGAGHEPPAGTRAELSAVPAGFQGDGGDAA